MYCDDCGGFFGDDLYKDFGELREREERFVVLNGKWETKKVTYFICNDCIEDERIASTPSDAEIELEAMITTFIKRGEEE